MKILIDPGIIEAYRSTWSTKITISQLK